MTLLWPSALLAVVPALPLAAVYLIRQRRRSVDLARYAGFAARQPMGRQVPAVRRHLPPVLFGLSLVTMGVALARPQMLWWVSHRTRTIILAIDVSGSMDTNDVFPNRMEATKAVARRFVVEQPADVKVGIVAFSDAALLVQAPTQDHDRLVAAITRLHPRQATNIGAGLRAALETIADETHRPLPSVTGTSSPLASIPGNPVPNRPKTRDDIRPPAVAGILLISDGESTTGPPPLEVALMAVTVGVTVSTISVGAEPGTILGIPGGGSSLPKEEATLARIAWMTGGRYVRSPDAVTLANLADNLAWQREQRHEQTEITAIVVSLGLMLSLAGGVLSLGWFHRLP